MARPPQDPRIRINEILDAAEPLFYEKGYHETSISDIVKRMGVAQGTVYYYFKSKEEILEALMNRHMASIFTEAEYVAYSDKVSPPQAFNILMQTIFRTVYYKGGLLFGFLYEDSTMHLVDKLCRQGDKVIAPLMQRIIEKGIKQDYFHIESPQAVSKVISAMLQCLIEVIYEKSPEETIDYQFKLVEDLAGIALGISTGVMKFRSKD